VFLDLSENQISEIDKGNTGLYTMYYPVRLLVQFFNDINKVKYTGTCIVVAV